MNVNNTPSKTKWQDALKKTSRFTTAIGSSLRHFLLKGIPWLLSTTIARNFLGLCIYLCGCMFASWFIAKALYPVLPVAMAESIKAAQQKDFAMSHEFFASTPELVLSVYVLEVGTVIFIVGLVIRSFLAHIFRPKDLLDKVASTEKELKAVQEELRRMKNAPR
jgi:multidrug efflux pump subunit AcrB